MILDGVPYRETLSETDALDKSLLAFTDLLERRLGVKVIKDLREMPFSRPDLAKPLALAALLKKKGIIRYIAETIEYPDLPKIKNWYAVCDDPTGHHTGGSTMEDDVSALYAALSEALERYIWFTQDDYFVDPTKATAAEIAKKGAYVRPEDIVGFSEEQRAKIPARKLRPDAQYLWIRGNSLTQGKPVYLPAQIVSGWNRRIFAKNEPFLRENNTNGLATWPTRNGARLGGIQELIEREAYMIIWLNQLTVPRIALAPLCENSPSLARAIRKFEKYRFKVHALQLPTDAPTHAVAVVLEDLGGNAPHFTLGLKAHTSLSTAVEKAMSEALRAQHLHRNWILKGNVWDPATPVESIGHFERLYYWAVPEHAKRLEFLLQGPEICIERNPWDGKSIDEHLQIFIAWCKATGLECISVPLTSSAKNPTSLHIEMMVMPQLHPTYLHEDVRQFGGSRLREVPKALGLTPREKPYEAGPHPFL